MATETEGIQAQSADISDTMVIVPVTGAIYHNGNEKPTERWCFELGMRTVSDKDFNVSFKPLAERIWHQGKNLRKYLRRNNKTPRSSSDSLMLRKTKWTV